MPSAGRMHHSSLSIPGGLRGLQLQLLIAPIHSFNNFLQGELNNLSQRVIQSQRTSQGSLGLISVAHQPSRPKSVTTSHLSNVCSLCNAVSRGGRESTKAFEATNPYNQAQKESLTHHNGPVSPVITPHYTGNQTGALPAPSKPEHQPALPVIEASHMGHHVQEKGW